MHSHYDIHFVKEQNPKNLSRLLKKAVDKREENKAWDIWISKYPQMSKDNYVSFSEFYKKPEVDKDTKSSSETVQDTFNRFKEGMV